MAGEETVRQGVIVLGCTEKRTGDDTHWELTRDSLKQLGRFLEGSINVGITESSKSGSEGGDKTQNASKVQVTGILRAVEPDYLLVNVMDGTTTDGTPLPRGRSSLYFHQDTLAKSSHMDSFVVEGQTFQLGKPPEQHHGRGFGGFLGRH